MGANDIVSPKLPGGETLPFAPVPSASIAGRTLQESTYAQRVVPPRLHDDAPNIVIVLIDDAGPGLPSTFGGEVRTDTMDRVCAEGVSYNRFPAGVAGLPRAGPVPVRGPHPPRPRRLHLRCAQAAPCGGRIETPFVPTTLRSVIP